MKNRRTKQMLDMPKRTRSYIYYIKAVCLQDIECGRCCLEIGLDECSSRKRRIVCLKGVTVREKEKKSSVCSSPNGTSGHRV